MFDLLLPRSLVSLSLDWLLARPCPLCHRLPPRLGSSDRAASDSGLCPSCSAMLALPVRGLSGSWPLRWWGSGLYEGTLRQVLLQQRRRPDREALRALLRPLCTALRGSLVSGRSDGLAGSLLTGSPPAAGAALPWLVTVPSWKRRGNPLPGLIAAILGLELGLHSRGLLERSRVVLGQHRLGRQLRLANQRDSFRCLEPPRRGASRPLLIVDDILTTGATARYAALCLERQGWSVLGLACLARTPSRSAGGRTS